MGTYWAAKWLGPAERPPEFCRAIIDDAFDEVIRQMSAWDDRSDLTRFNRAEAGSWRELPAEFFTVLQRAVEIARESAGAFDPTVGEFVDLLGFGPSGPDVEINTAPLDAARARLGWSRLRLDAENRRAFQPGGLWLDLSAIAKGFFRRAFASAGMDFSSIVPTADEQRLIDFGRAIVANSNSVPEDIWNGLKARYDDTTLVNLVAFAGIMVATALFNNVVKVDFDTELLPYADPA